MQLKAKYVDMESAEYTAVLHTEDALEIGVREQDRVRIKHERSSAVTLVQTTDTVVNKGEVGILGKAWETLGPDPDEAIEVVATSKPESIEFIKKKMNGKELSTEEIRAIVNDISTHNLSNIELTAYVTALYINGMNLRETADLTQAMVETGETIKFDRSPVYDFHSVGGCPGNKITLIVVPIVAAAGLLIPKTSSRAISSAAGTSDIVEVFARVDFDGNKLRSIAETTGGSLAWGGSVNLAPADDLIIKVEYPLGIDPHAQLLASVMSKKKAVGTEFLVIDIPMGAGTKVPTMEKAQAYAKDFVDLGERLGMHVECAITYGEQPVGRAVGPALEAREAIAILEGELHPSSVIEKACGMAGMLLEMAGMKRGEAKAREILMSGKALDKFREIVAAQGGDPNIRSTDIRVGKFTHDITATMCGYVNSIRNKEIVALARAAGSPRDKGAGVLLHKKRGNRVDDGEAILTIYADTQAKLDQAVELSRKLNPVSIEGMILAKLPYINRTTVIERTFCPAPGAPPAD
ncbi:MAG: AMP phosphorylase [Methanomassiliicoccus sp.]|nr:AMP phosphorylase [Methanomassiliicoccus sp.]